MDDDQVTWDIPRLRKYAELLSARRTPGPLALEAEAPRGSQAARWFLDRAERVSSSEEDRINGRFKATPGDIPGSLKSAMMECQKPFHLWNVNREEWTSRESFVKGPKYEIGRAAVENGPSKEGQPGTVVPCSKVAREQREADDLVRSEAFGFKRRLRRQLTQDPAEEGLGLPDEPLE